MYDVTVIGCGVIGAAIAHQLSRYRLRVLVLEKENDVATGTTKANSAIIHAGYDPTPGTLMARLNVRGAALMGELTARLCVAYRRTGSLVLALEAEDLEPLEELYEKGVANGVPGLTLLSGPEALALEPALNKGVKRALWAPSAAIVDPWGLCLALAEVAVRNGAELRRSAGVTAIRDLGRHYRLETATGVVESRFLVNCAGVGCEEINKLLGGGDFTTIPNRGEYYLLDKSSGGLVSHVIFQCPTEEGKGVLVAPTVHGNLLAGPSAEDVCDADDTSTTAEALERVAAAVEQSVPQIDLRQSIRNFAGIRANTTASDFVIAPLPASSRLLQVAAIKSPGLSAAPAIAEYALERLAEMGLPLEEKETFTNTRTQVRFRDLSPEGQAALVAKNPLYGRVVCRCETITEGEILDAVRSPIPPCSLDGVKRRAGAGMGRCQGGFCGPRVLEILARELNLPWEAIVQDRAGSQILLGKTAKGGGA